LPLLCLPCLCSPCSSLSPSCLCSSSPSFRPSPLLNMPMPSHFCTNSAPSALRLLCSHVHNLCLLNFFVSSALACLCSPPHHVSASLILTAQPCFMISNNILFLHLPLPFCPFSLLGSTRIILCSLSNLVRSNESCL
jgi:hypothetical protein